ncbi:MAG: alpha/beta hydrolase [Chloroflexota bacterium]|nr:alpha/beta hydrolase [Chloroflexota bacterium]
MNYLLRFLASIVTLSGLLLPIRFTGMGPRLFIWIPRVLATSLSPLMALVGAIVSLAALRQRQLVTAAGSLVGTGLAARYIIRVVAPHDGFSEAFGPNWPTRVPPELRSRLAARRWPLILPPSSDSFQHDVVFAINDETGRALKADIWQPPAGVPRTGLAVIFVHGGAWRIGEKDLGTRPMFRRLVRQGHTIMDIEYTMAPDVLVPAMVVDVNRAILWLKINAADFKVDPERIVLMGESAGGHLALMAAYTPGDPAFQPPEIDGDTSVRAVVSFYAPIDMLLRHEDIEQGMAMLDSDPWTKAIQWPVEMVLKLTSLVPWGMKVQEAPNYIAAVLGNTPDQDPQLFRRLSPNYRVSEDSPPTLLLQGSADAFDMAPDARDLHQKLQAAGVPSVLAEFPGADHAFILMMPTISPAAQAAFQDLEHFLALMV